MTTTRKSFLLHIDSLEILDELTNEQCGLLFKACRDFNTGDEIKLDPVLSLVFFSLKKQFERDQVKYKIVVDRNKANGSKGGRPKGKINPDEPSKPSGLIDNPSEPRKADSVNGSDNDNDSKSDNKSKEIATSKGRFTPPLDIETVAYFESKGSTAAEAEKFWLFYDSKNWMVGKSKMQKWKSSASGWIKRNQTEVNKTDILAASSASNWHEEDLGL